MLLRLRTHHSPLFSLLLGGLSLLGVAGCTTPAAPPSAFTSSSAACGPGALGEAIAPYSLISGGAGAERGLLALDGRGGVFALNGPGDAVLEALSSGGQVTVLGATDGEIQAVHLDATSVYYATAGGLFSMPRSGGPARKIAPPVRDFAVGTNAIYATSGTSPAIISFVPGNGAPSTPMYSSPGPAQISNLTVDGLHVYWLETRPSTQGDPSSVVSVIRSAPVGGTLEASDVVTLPYWTNGVLSFAVVSGNVVYVTLNNDAEVSGQPVSTYEVHVAYADGTSLIVDSGPAGESLAIPLVMAGDEAYYDLGAGVRHLWLDGFNTVSTIAPPPALAGAPEAGASPTRVNAIAVDSTGHVVFETESCVYRLATAP